MKMQIVKRAALLITLISGLAFAQVDEFALPQQFESPADAGVPEPSPPPMPEVAKPPAPPKPPPDPSWARMGGSASVMFSALNGYYFGAEVALLATVAGTPIRSPTVVGEIEGFMLQVGGEASYGRVGGLVCEGSPFCAQRISGGATLKAGWARGMPNVRDNVARAQTMYFGQVDVLLSNFNIESAPLAPGVNAWELITRGRLGLHFTSDAARTTFTGVTLFAAAFVEGIPASSVTRGVTIGFCAGVGF
jgi:hypothetical protein